MGRFSGLVRTGCLTRDATQKMSGTLDFRPFYTEASVAVERWKTVPVVFLFSELARCCCTKNKRFGQGAFWSKLVGQFSKSCGGKRFRLAAIICWVMFAGWVGQSRKTGGSMRENSQNNGMGVIFETILIPRQKNIFT